MSGADNITSNVTGRGRGSALQSTDRLIHPSWALLVCLGLLQLSQVLILRPGTSASPWDAVTYGLDPITAGPFTAQEWALGAVALAGLLTWALRYRTWDAVDHGIIAASLAVALPAICTTAGVVPYAEGVGKVLLPLLAYLAVRRGPRRRLTVLFTAVNIFVIAQTLVAKLVTGEFAANSYYLELDEEYFGYFHHPFAFSGILGACTIVAVHQLVHGSQRARVLHVGLIALNLWLILASQVRTYLVALAIALAVLCAGLLLRFARRTALVGLGLVVLGLVAATFTGIFGQDRAVGDVTSGRFSRWVDDIDFFVENAALTQWFFGGGADYVFQVNEQLSGVSINSLNFFVDSLLNFGVVGLTAILVAWGLVLAESVRRDRSPFTVAMAIFIVIAALVTSPFEFPALGVFLAVGMAAMPIKAKEENT